MKDNERLRIKTEYGYVELFIPEGFKQPDLDSVEYKEFRLALMKLIGAEK